MNVTMQSFSRLVGSIYEATLAPAEWRSALEQICAALGTPAASIHVVDPVANRTRFLAEFGGDPVFDALAITTYAAMNPAGAAILVGEVDQPLGLFDLIDEEELVQTRWYKEWCAPQRYHDMMGAIIAKRATEIGALSSVRLVDQPRFGAEEREFLALIAPHVRRAVTISALLEQQAVDRDTFAAVMDRLSAAILLVDQSRVVVKSNRAADELMEGRKILRLANRRLVLADPAADAAFRRAVQAPGEEPQFVPLPAADGGVMVAAVVSVDRKAGLRAVLLHAQEPEPPMIAKALQAAFRLTPREICVLMQLLAGEDIAGIADRLGVARTTAKTHLERIFAKTGTNRQADLVARVMQAATPARAG